MDSLDRTRAVFEELNRPSRNRLAAALKARAIAYTTKALDEVIGKSTDKQLEAPAYKHNGKIASPDVNARWTCDTIDLTQYPSKAKCENKNPCAALWWPRTCSHAAVLPKLPRPFAPRP